MQYARHNSARKIFREIDRNPQNYLIIHYSCESFYDNRAVNNTLKVNSKWTEIYGVSIQGILNYCKDTWWIQLIWTIVSMFLGALIGEFVGNIL